MKNLIFIITLIFVGNVYAQEEFKNPKTFVRVYNLQGTKINKGKILKVTDTTLVLKRNKGFVEIPLNRIGSIKTKRSGINNILIGAAAGSIIGASTVEDSIDLEEFRGPYVMLGGVSGAAVGSAIGGITILFKNSKSYEVNGDELKWKVFKETITEHRQ